ncbi:MAG: YeeE/YedE thiosulfate transporter family protein [Ignavibacteriales bacterium]|nr:YeeE/YedE thiosulfate transporter family protein [Ignavibacteriales bacterium]
MAPLVPEVIGNELNFIVALFIGVAFGFVLEQAGFSTSKKLVGLFYGYDFTVLRVFFTAGVVAMIGVIAFNHWGLIDISLVYVNPTFLWSAIVGGLIMGLGFVVGGFCPGTSVCAAAIGKIDAMIFVGGSFIGVFVFAEGYPLFEGLYKSANWGSPRMFETLGMSQSLFAFLLTVVAVGAFWVTSLIENKVNRKSNPEFSSKPLYYSLTAIALILALSAFALPDRKEMMLKEVNNLEYVTSYTVNTMDSDELAFRLIDDDPNLQLIDLRSQKEFDALSLPKSTRVNIENLFEKDAHKLLTVRRKINVFLANDEITAKKAAVLANELGYTEIYLLQGGFKQFQTEILNFQMPGQTTNQHDADTYRFRTKARQVLPILIKENKLKQGSMGNKQTKRVVGGC